MIEIKDLHELPKVKDSLSYIYIEHAKIRQDRHSIAIYLRKINVDGFNLELFQIFNMTRKKENVLLLLNLVKHYFEDLDLLLVFNKNFDIKIIKSIIEEFSLDITMPSNIVDLQDFFPNLKTLEEFLKARVGIRRQTTDKDKYLEYYRRFKGKGKKGYNKQIEPIGTYNLTDVLTPLYAYLLLNPILKNKKGDK